MAKFGCLLADARPQTPKASAPVLFLSLIEFAAIICFLAHLDRMLASYFKLAGAAFTIDN